MLKLSLDDVRQGLESARLEVVSQNRLSDDSGVQLQLRGGGSVNVYDNGTVLPQGPSAPLLRAIFRGMAVEREGGEPQGEVLEQIRDLGREQVARLTQMVGMYEQVLAAQQKSAGTYQDLIRRVRRLLLAAGALIILILVIMLLMVVRIWGRFG